MTLLHMQSPSLALHFSIGVDCLGEPLPAKAVSSRSSSFYNEVMAETTLYDTSGSPVAYIADDGETIYTWHGQALTYLVDENLYGWNGLHLGWFVRGVVYDLRGRRAGFLSSTSPVATRALPAKRAKRAQRAKRARRAARARPALSTARSEAPLTALLEQGR